MQRAPRFIAAFVVAFLLLLHGPGAAAAVSGQIQPVACKAEASRALGAAEDALRQGDQPRAIACLIEALRELKQAAADTGTQTPKALIAPQGAWRNQK